MALPAVANTLATLPISARATIVRVNSHHDYPLPLTDRVTVVTAPRDPDGIVATVQGLDLPQNTHAFVHGEAAMVRPMRRHLRLERGLPRDRIHPSAYWFAGRDADGWRAIKQDFNRSMEGRDEVFSALDAAAPLLRATEGQSTPCWGGNTFIDHILAGGAARGWMAPDSLRVLVYRETGAAARALLPDHCPVSVRLRPPD